jgi:hypothetical protein
MPTQESVARRAIHATTVADSPSAPFPLAATLVWAGAIATAMSTQYLFQPFVWENWPWDEVLAGWLAIVRDRLLLALAIAAAVLVASRLPLRSRLARGLALAMAIAAGAVLGELARVSLDTWNAAPDAGAFVLQVLHWCALAGAVTAMYGGWRTMVSIRARAERDELRVATLERDVAQARLAALRRQIEPHFLFNTLATIRHLHDTRPAEGARVLRSFLDYLRLTKAAFERGTNSLGEESALVRAYLDVVVVRMSGRLTARFAIPDELRRCAFPTLALATLVENAVKHGIGPRPEGGTIEISARRAGDALEVVVADDGAGFGASVGNGIGLSNVRAQLQALHGAHAALTLAGNAPRGVRATVRVPCGSVAAVP